MSAIISKKQDSLNNYFTNLFQFENMKQNLLTQNEDGFVRWFDKLRIIDPRITWIYLNLNQTKLTNFQRVYAEKTYNQSLSNKQFSIKDD